MMRLLFLLFVFVRVASANVIFMSGFETPDLTSANADSYEWYAVSPVSNSDSDIGLVGNGSCSNDSPWTCCRNGAGTDGKGNCQHNQLNGGAQSSHWALRANPASGEQVYYTLPENSTCTGNRTCSTANIEATGSAGSCDCCTAAGTGNCIPNLPPTFPRLSASFNFRVDTAPSGTREIFRITEEGARQGCNVRINSDRTLSLYYGTTAGPGTNKTGETAANLVCVNDPTLGCTVSGDCPSGGCSASCSDAAESGCYWMPIQLSEELVNGGARCDLRVRGRLSLQATFTDSSTRAIDNVRIGAPGTEAVALTAYFDDFVLDDGLDSGFGYVGMSVPQVANPGNSSITDGSSSSSTWEKTSNAQTYAGFTNDFGDVDGGLKLAGSGDIDAKTPGSLVNFWRGQPLDGLCSTNADCAFATDASGAPSTSCNGGGYCQTPTPVLTTSIPGAANIRITGVEPVAVGKTSGTAGNRRIYTRTGICGTNTLTPKGSKRLTDVNLQANTHVWARGVDTTAPGTVAWEDDDMANLCWGYQAGSSAEFTSGAKTYIEATVIYWRADRQAPPVRNLSDHNQGVRICSADGDCGGGTGSCICPTGQTCPPSNKVCVKDGKIALVTVGDSTNAATYSQTCSGGETAGQACTQKDYCSWDVGTGHFKDKPPGGCGRNNELCRICSSRIDENGGFGWPCTTNNQCPSSSTCNTGTGQCKDTPGTSDIDVPCCAGGTCVSGTCSGGTYNGQTCNSSCGGLGGTCYSTATCDLSCPGGGCYKTTGASPAGSGTVCSENADCPTGENCYGHCSVTTTTRCDKTSQCPNGESCVTVGVCPTERAQWGAYITDDIDADVLLVCGQGGEKLTEMVQNRSAKLLYGDGTTCIAVKGNGQCTCTSDADCGGGVGSCTVPSPAFTDGKKICNTGTEKQAACLASQDCATGSGQFCRFPATDYFVVIEGYNDVAAFTLEVFSPNCRGGFGQFPLCDRAWGLGNVLTSIPVTTCMKNSECSGVSEDSMCMGVTTNVILPAEGLGVYCGTSAAENANCSIDSRSDLCATSATCRYSGTCVCPVLGGTPICSEQFGVDTLNIGRCESLNACASGFTQVGGNCHKDCTVDADCGGGAGMCSKWCTSGSDVGRKCTVNGDCPGSGTCGSSKVCLGRCNAPSTAYPCTKDTDCRVGRQDYGTGFVGLPEGFGSGGLVHEFQGTCCLTPGGCNGVPQGRCTCTGHPPLCESMDLYLPVQNKCFAQAQKFVRENGHLNIIDQLNKIQGKINAFGQPSALSPKLVPGTIPRTNCDSCSSGWPEDGYYAKASIHMLNTFPLASNTRLAADICGSAAVHSDRVHFKPKGAICIGHAFRDTIRTFGTCAVGSGASASAQLYCLGPDQTTYKTCTNNSDCSSAGGVCDCVGGAPCSGGSGYCTCTDASQCPGAHTCSVKKCPNGNGDCPAVADACRVES